MAAEPNTPDIGAARRDRTQTRQRRVAALAHEQANVEAEVIRMLYGDPSRRHRAYATCGHDHTPEMRGAAPDSAPDRSRV